MRRARLRLAVLASHPVQYQAPMLRRLATEIDLAVFFAHRATPESQARAGFGVGFAWDVDLTSGYEHTVLRNVARRPGTDRFAGCDTPDIRVRLGEGRFGALLVMGWHLRSYWQGLVAAKRIGLPVLVRGDSQLDTPRAPLKRAAKTIGYPPLLRLIDAALPVGSRSRAYLRYYGFPEARIHLVPHSVDVARFAAGSTETARRALRAERGIGDGAHVVLFAGRLVDFKRPLDLVAAAALLRQRSRPVEVMIAGDGALRQAIVDAATATGVRLHMLGFCNQAAMPGVYAAADCLVLPSDGHETWGLVANEALASGRPIVVSDACGCAPDLAADGIAGRAFHLGDIVGLADAIDRVLARPRPAAAIAALSARNGPAASVAGIVAALEAVAAGRAAEAWARA